ncbi:MAG: hypothetical protein K2W86_08945 [Sphingomonas sp.]|uniref:hypothetical protein n=1 Tax=Sphingomonas sp. TaxID=28214 RepID=UPI0035A95C83|nr:hypothetical protein [Sphingomonas sp.]
MNEHAPQAGVTVEARLDGACTAKERKRREHPAHRIMTDGFALEAVSDFGRHQRDTADRPSRRDDDVVGGLVVIERIDDGRGTERDQRLT